MRRIWLSLAAALAASNASAGQFAYPTQGQDKAQQAKDATECSTWAAEQAGFDPAKAALQAAKPHKPKVSTDQAMAALSAFSGGGGGNSSAIGTALGAFGGKAGSQAATGLQLAGVANQLLGSHPAQAQAAPPTAPGQTDYDQARAACLTGRGYSVR